MQGGKKTKPKFLFVNYEQLTVFFLFKLKHRVCYLNEYIIRSTSWQACVEWSVDCSVFGQPRCRHVRPLVDIMSRYLLQWNNLSVEYLCILKAVILWVIWYWCPVVLLQIRVPPRVSMWIQTRPKSFCLDIMKTKILKTFFKYRAYKL